MKTFIYSFLFLFVAVVATHFLGYSVDGSHLHLASLFGGDLSHLPLMGMAAGVMTRQVPQVMQAERTRIMPSKTYAPNQIVQLDLNKDTVVKSFSITLAGGLQVTFTGTYTASFLTSFDALIPNIQVVVNGSRTVKFVRPWLVSTKTFFANGNQNERKASAGAAVLNPPNPTADGGWAVGTSTQYTTVRETIDLYFQDILARPGSQGLTFLNLAGASSAVMNFNCAAYASVEAVNNAATGISYANSSLIINTQSREAQDLVGQKFSDLKETTQARLFTGQTTNFPIDINRGNFVRGIWLMCRDGDATRALSNNAIQQVSLKANGFTPIKEYDLFAKIQAENRTFFGINAPLTAGVSRIDGIAYIDLLNDKDPTTALDARFLDNLQLFVTTAASGAGATYTNAVELTVQTDEYVLPA